MYFVYILKSSDKQQYYKGSTNDLDRRLKEHFSGHCPTTRKLLPLQLIHVEICETRTEACRIEKFYKTGAGREIITKYFGSIV